MKYKKCLECEEDFIGRLDKKFCSDMCRNVHNNRQNKDGNNMIRNVNNRLRKNWRILEVLNPQEKCKVSKQKLDAQGFDFSHYTSTYKTKVGTVYYFVYDQGYLPLENDYFALVKRN